VRAQSGDISGGDDREVKILSEMMRHAVGAIEPGGAHRASLGLPLSVHQVVDEHSGHNSERCIHAAKGPD
jgi:hypothetical protein